MADLFGGVRKFGEKLAIAMEKEAQAWIETADRDTTTPHSIHNRYVGATIRAIAKVIREVTKDE